MNIGLFTHNYPLNPNDRKDAGIFLYDFAQSLSKKHKVYVLAPKFKGVKHKYKDVPVEWFDWSGGNEKLGDWKVSNPISAVKFFELIYQGSKSAVKFTKDKKINFILAAWAMPSGAFAYYANKRTGVPYATWSLGSDINTYVKYPILRQMTMLSLSNAKTRFANSYALATKIEKLIHKQVDFLPAITDLSMKQKARKSPKKFTFLYVGRLERVKGIDILIEAASKLPKNNSWQIDVVGDGNLEQQMKQMISNYKLEGYINLLGRQGASVVAQHMMSSSCLVVPSRNESLPLVIIEAARAGLPVIASDVGDCKRLIVDYKVGSFFKPQDSLALSKKMSEAISNRRKWKISHLQGLRRIAEEFKQTKATKIFISSIK